MYIYYNDEGVLKTQIPHGEIVRQGSDFNLTVCFNPSFENTLGYVPAKEPFNANNQYYTKSGTKYIAVSEPSEEIFNLNQYYQKATWADVVLAAQILLTDGKTTRAFKTARDVEDIIFEKANDAEIIYDLIPGNPYKTYTFSWSATDYPEITDKAGNIKVKIGVFKVTGDADESDGLEPAEIIETKIEGVISVFVEAVLGYVPKPTIGGSNEHYKELHDEDLWLQKQINDIMAFPATKQDKIDPNIHIDGSPDPDHPDEPWSVVGAINKLQDKVHQVYEDMKFNEVSVGELDWQATATPTGYTLPDDSDLNDFVFEVAREQDRPELIEDGNPKNGCVIIVVQQIPNATDRIYKYIFSADGWVYYEIPAIEPAKFNSLGSVKGTYYVLDPQNQQFEHPVLVDIDNGVIKNVYLKGTYFVKAEEFEEGRVYYEPSMSGYIIVQNPVAADIDNYWVRVQEDSYSSLQNILDNTLNVAEGFIIDLSIDGLTLKFTFNNGRQFTVPITANYTSVRTVTVDETFNEVQSGSDHFVTANVVYEAYHRIKTEVIPEGERMGIVGLYLYNNFNKIEYIEMEFDVSDVPAEREIIQAKTDINANGTTHNYSGYELTIANREYAEPVHSDAAIRPNKFRMRFIPRSVVLSITNNYTWVAQTVFEGSYFSRTDVFAAAEGAQHFDVVPLTLKFECYTNGGDNPTSSNGYGNAVLFRPDLIRNDGNNLRIEKKATKNMYSIDEWNYQITDRSIVIRLK